MKKQNKTLVIAFVALVILVAAFAAIWLVTRDKPVEGAKTITVNIIVDDQTARSVEIKTDAEYLLQALRENDLVEGSDGAFGFWVTSVNGIVPDDGNEEWWALFKNGEFAMTGPDQMVIEDGDMIEYRLTVGYDTFF